MTEHCKFESNLISVCNHYCRLLEITCENGFSAIIYVTQELPFEEMGPNNIMFRAWHYELSNDEKFITLTGINNHSVVFDAVEPNSCHPTITNWPLYPQ